MGHRLKCWDHFECGKGECPVYQSKEFKCWLVTGTLCRNEIQGEYLEKMEMCLQCEVFKANMDVQSMEQTITVLASQFNQFRRIVDERDRELEHTSMELALGLSEVFEGLKRLSSGDPQVRVPEASELELIRKLKHMVNLTAGDLGQIVNLSHEFAMGLAEHFGVLHRVTKGDLNARISGHSQVELLESLKLVTNEMIESVKSEMTSRMRAEEALRESEGRLRKILDSLQVGAVVIDAETHMIVDANPLALELIGLPKKQVVGHVCHKFICPAEEGKCPVSDLGQTVDKSERVLLNAKGQSIPVLKTVTSVFLNGRPYLIDSFVDITEQKRNEKALRESENLRRTVINATQEAIIAIGEDGLITIFNPGAEKMFGRKRDEMIGAPLDCLMPEEYREQHREHIRNYFSKGDPANAIGKTVDLPALRSDGSEFSMEISLSAASYGNKQLIIAVARDITERKRAEEALRESGELIRATLESTADGILVVNEEGRGHTCQRTFCQDVANTRGAARGTRRQEAARTRPPPVKRTGSIPRESRFTLWFIGPGLGHDLVQRW